MMIPRLLRHMHKLCAAETTRYAITGVQFTYDPTTYTATVAATNGFALLAATYDVRGLAAAIDGVSGSAFTLLIPARAYRDLFKSTLTTRVALTEWNPDTRRAIFLPDRSADGQRITVDCEDATFPDYRHVIPPLNDGKNAYKPCTQQYFTTAALGPVVATLADFPSYAFQWPDNPLKPVRIGARAAADGLPTPVTVVGAVMPAKP